MTSKLNNFPTVNAISITESVDRRNLLLSKFGQHDITNIRFHIFEKFQESNFIIRGNRINELAPWTKGALISHLQGIKSWLSSCEDEYTFFCEDDISLDTVQYWNFNWSEFIDNLPKNWGAVQLAWIKPENESVRFFDNGFKLRNRFWEDWSACAYLITRHHAKQLIEKYNPEENVFVFDYAGFDIGIRPSWALLPVIETILFTNFESSNIYTFPMFVEDRTNCLSTYSDYELQEQQEYIHNNSITKVMDMWKNTMQHMTVKELTNI